MNPFDSDRRLMYGIRCKIGELQALFRAKYGNKGVTSKRFDNPMWQKIENRLKQACTDIFEAEREIFTLPKVPDVVTDVVNAREILNSEG